MDQSYIKRFGPGPHLTADAVVISNDGYILLIKRNDTGLTALPGGFLENKRNETLEECARRECLEETNLIIDDVPEVSKEFSDPNRDSRARIITHAYLYVLSKPAISYQIKAGDDAKQVFWVKLNECMSSDIKYFADHREIIKKIFDLYKEKVERRKMRLSITAMKSIVKHEENYARAYRKIRSAINDIGSKIGIY